MTEPTAATPTPEAAPAPPAPSLDAQVEAQREKVAALSSWKGGGEYQRELAALEALYAAQATAEGKGPAPAPDTTNADAVEAHAFAREYPLEGVDPDTGEPLTWDTGSRRVLQ